MRQPWDRSQRFPVIAAGGEFGTSRLSKSEPSPRDSCKPHVLCRAQCAQRGKPACSGLATPKMQWVQVTRISGEGKNGEES